MPQMYPMMWMNLYIYSLILFFFFMIKLYFFFYKPLKQKNMKIKTNYINMKW